MSTHHDYIDIPLFSIAQCEEPALHTDVIPGLEWMQP